VRLWHCAALVGRSVAARRWLVLLADELAATGVAGNNLLGLWLLGPPLIELGCGHRNDAMPTRAQSLGDVKDRQGNGMGPTPTAATAGGHGVSIAGLVIETST
jgi:hypothetical protein